MRKLSSFLSRSVRKQLLVSFSATILFFLGGTAMGWPSPNLARLKKEDSDPHITSSEGSWIASFIAIGGVVAQVPAGYLMDTIGRKAVLLSLALPFLITWILIIFGQSAIAFYFSMLLAGMGLGTGFSVGPTYLTEIAEDHIRGALATFFQVMMNLGTLFSYCIGPYMPMATAGIICAVFPLVFFATFIWMPESPYFYLLKNRREDAERSLMRLRAVSDPQVVQQELSDMQQFVEENRRQEGNWKMLFTNRGNRRALVVVLGLMVFQNVSGNNALLAYSTIIFQESSKKLSPEVSVIITGATQVTLSLICSSIVDIAGRRPMLLISTAGCALAMFVEGLFFFLKVELEVDMSGYDWVSLAAIVFFLIVYTIGLGPLPLTMVGELFPTNVKGVASSFSCFVLSAVGIIVPKLYQLVADEFGMHVAFWVFSVCSVLGTIFVAILVPETKGKSLMDINKEMNSNP